MSDFGGLVRDDTSEDKAEAKNPESKAKSSSKSNASLASVLGADDVASLTRKYDLDPELETGRVTIADESKTVWLWVLPRFAKSLRFRFGLLEICVAYVLGWF